MIKRTNDAGQAYIHFNGQWSKKVMVIAPTMDDEAYNRLGATKWVNKEDAIYKMNVIGREVRSAVLQLLR